MPASHDRAVALAVLLAALLLSGSVAYAGGPLLVRGNGLPFVWSTATPISYRTDNGPLSANVDEPTVRARVGGMFDVWQNVATSNISYARAATNGGFINATGAFAGGDVDTIAEFNAVDADCDAGNQSPIVYDADGTIFDALGKDETSVIGFAGPCALSGTQILSSLVVMNGLFQDGIDSESNPELTTDDYDAAIIHEIGHFSGLDHSQINVNCLGSCGAADLAGLPTMFPFLFEFASQEVLSIDDIAWISRLYPHATFASTHGTITGTVFFSDGESHASSVNVIARRSDLGANGARSNAVSVVSGFKFRAFQGNPINDPTGSPFGSLSPGDIGLFEIPVPAGSYTVEVESIDPGFTGGSRVGPFPIVMPGTAPAPSGVIVVNADATVSGNDFILIGTDPRFDQFEGP